MSVWCQLDENEQDEVTAQFVDVITMCKSCPEPVQAILNLAEFMDHSEKVRKINKYLTILFILFRDHFPWIIECWWIVLKQLELMQKPSDTMNWALLKSLFQVQKIVKQLLRLFPFKINQFISAFRFANKLNLEEASIGIVKFAEKNNMTISVRS